MKSGNVCKFLVFPTFVPRHAKTPEILAAKVGNICREVYTVILLKSSLTQHYGFWFWISKHVFVPITFFVSDCSTYNLSLPSMSMDHDSNQVMKFLYMLSDWSVSVLNKGLKLELHLLRLICVYVLNCMNCAEYWIGKMGTKVGILTKSKMYRLDS